MMKRSGGKRTRTQFDLKAPTRKMIESNIHEKSQMAIALPTSLYARMSLGAEAQILEVEGSMR